MADYTGGYTSAVNNISLRRREDAASASIEDALKEALSLRMREAKARESAVGEMGIPPPPGGPQPPPPGQASQPGIQAQGQGGPPGPPPMGAAGGMSPMPPPSWRPSPVSQMRPPPPMGGLPGGGAPGASPAGGASPGMPAPQQMPPPPPKPSAEQIDQAGTKVMPAAADWVKQTIQSMQKKGKSAGEIADTLEVMKGWHDDSMKEQYNSAIVDLKAKEAATHFYKAEVDRLTAEVKMATEERRAGDASRKADQADRKIDLMAQKLAHGGAGGSSGEPLTQDQINYYARQSLKGDNSWQVGLARGKAGQVLIDKVKRRIPEMAKEENISPEEAIGNKAELGGQQAALKQRQQFVSAGQQFVRNLQSQADLVEKYMVKGTAGGVPVLNKWIQAGRKGVAGDPDVTALDTAIRGLAREHQRIVTGVTSNAQLHVSAQETADELLNRSMTVPQIKSTIKVMREEADNAVKAGQQELGDLRSRISSRPGSSGGPKAGTVENGYRFKGGDPAKKENWEKV